MPEIVDISDDADEVMEVEDEQSSMSVNFGELELTLDSTLNITDSSLNSTIEEITVESESDDDDIEIVRESAAAIDAMIESAAEPVVANTCAWMIVPMLRNPSGLTCSATSSR